MTSILTLVATALLVAAPSKANKKPRVLVASVESEVIDGRLEWRDGPTAIVEAAVREGAARTVRPPRRLRAGGEDLATWIFDVATLAPLGKRAKADIVLALSMRLRLVEGASGVTVRGSGEVMALDVVTAEKLAVLSVQTSASGSNAVEAKEKLYREWGARFAPLLERKVLSAWAIQSQRGAVFRMTLNGGKKKQRLRFVRALERVPKVVNVRTLSELDDRVSLEVSYRGTGEALVRGVFQHVARRRPFRGLTRVGRQTKPIQLEWQR